MIKINMLNVNGFWPSNCAQGAPLMNDELSIAKYKNDTL